MAPSPVNNNIVRVSELKAGQPQGFKVAPDASERQMAASELGLVAVKKLQFEGSLEPFGDADWILNARLGATVVQNCVVSLEPVTTRIDEAVQRTFVAALPDVLDGDEFEMPDDETVEQLPHEIDLSVVMIEALTLALPLYPRAEGVEAPNMNFTEPGKTALRNEDLKPFAGLAEFKTKLENGEE